MKSASIAGGLINKLKMEKEPFVFVKRQQNALEIVGKWNGTVIIFVKNRSMLRVSW